MRSFLSKILRSVLHVLFFYVRPRDALSVSHLTLGEKGKHSFIGYYDIQPFSKDESLLLAGRCSAYHKGRAMDAPLEIGYYTIESKVFQKIDETSLWSWQQGCRLQWLHYKNRDYIAYNTLRDGKAVCVLYSLKSQRVEHCFPFAVYAFSQDGRFAATLDFEYLQQCRPGYGYDCPAAGEREPSENGTYIHIYNLDEAVPVLKTEIRMADLLKSCPAAGGAHSEAVHYFNHLHFNPEATRLMAFHIWDAAEKRSVRAITMNLDGSDMADVTGGSHVSHYWWLDNDRLLFYGTDPQQGLGYHIYKQDGSGLLRSLDNAPDIDGHPSSSPVRDFLIVSDTVEDRFYRRHMWLYNLQGDKCVGLGYLHSVKWFHGAQRCDFHPRWSVAGNYVALDSAHEGFRQIVVLKDIDRI